MKKSHKVDFLDLQFDGGSIETAIDEILGASGEPFRYIVTPNVQHVVEIHEQGDALRAKYAAAWRVYCDSRVLRKLAQWCGARLDVVTGSDLTAGLLARASDRRLKIAIIGPSAADCAVLGRRFRGLRITSYAPPMGFITSDAEVQKCISFILASDADLIFLALGAPKQEMLAYRLLEHPETKGVALCIGASIDFLTGKQQRAPLWIQHLGLEWLHRLLSDPNRLAKRYLVECPKIFGLVLVYLFNRRAHS